MKVLAIGNSFSNDATCYLAPIAELSGKPMRTLGLYIGGCRLSYHHENMLADAAVYKPCYDTELTGLISIRQALLADKWDVVTLQQQSAASLDYSTYQPYLNEIAAYVRMLCPEAKLMIHQTWGYQTGSEKIRSVGYRTYEEMFSDLKKAYRQAADAIEAEIIPSGQAMQNLLTLGMPYIHADCYHARRDISRVMLAILWYTCLNRSTPANLSDLVTDVPLSEEELTLAQKAAYLAAEEYGYIR